MLAILFCEKKIGENFSRLRIGRVVAALHNRAVVHFGIEPLLRLYPVSGTPAANSEACFSILPLLAHHFIFMLYHFLEIVSQLMPLSLPWL